MNNLQKKFVLFLFLAFSFLKMEAQTSFAVTFQDSIDAFVEEVFFKNDKNSKSILSIKDSTLPLIIEMHDELELVDYNTFREEYEKKKALSSQNRTNLNN